MTKPKGGFIVFVMFVLFCVVVPVLFLKTYITADNYIDNGIAVKCSVVSVEKSDSFFKRDSVSVTYISDSDEVKASLATLNSVSEGDSVTAYVLEDSPEEVYYPLPKSLRKVCTAAIIILFTGSLFFALNHIRLSRRYNLLVKKGKSARATVQSAKESGNVYKAVMTFKDADRQDVTCNFKLVKAKPYEGESYSIIYYRKPDGKYIAEVYEI